jgi:hypothetical protein
LLKHSTLRTALAGAATVLAAVAIAAPANAAVDYFRGASPPDSPDRVLPAVQDKALNFTMGD